MKYPDEIWADTDLVCSDEPHEGWQKYRRVDESDPPNGMRLSKTEMLDGKPVKCYVEDKPSNARADLPPVSDVNRDSGTATRSGG